MLNVQHSYPVDVVGTERLISEGFTVSSIKIDNPTGMWLYVGEVGKYIPPNTLVWISNVTPPTNTIHIYYVNSLVGGVTSAVTGGPITVTTYDGIQPESNGLSYTASTSADIAVLQADLALIQAAIALSNAKLDLLVIEQASQGLKLNSIDLELDAQATAAAQGVQTAVLGSVKTAVDTNTTKLDTIAANQATQATATAQATQSTKLDAIKTSVDTGNTAQATATAQATQSTKLDTVIANTQPLNNPLINATVSITTSATLIRTASGKEIIGIYNSSATTTVYIGPSGVTTTTGFPLLPGEKMSLALDSQSVYGRVVAGTATVYVMRAALT